MEDTVPDGEVKVEMERYGRVMFVRKHAAVPFCREVHYFDVRAAQRAYNAIYPHSSGVPTISEVSLIQPCPIYGMSYTWHIQEGRPAWHIQEGRPVCVCHQP